MQPIDTTGCRGNTIKVASGHYFDLADPDPGDVDIRSIAASLSKICRYGGHCPKFYSVAEHSFLAAQLAFDQGHPREAIAAALLHDAAEAYCGDVVKPLKNMLPDYRAIEQRVEAAIETAMRLDFKRWHPIVKGIDRILLKAEKAALFPRDSEPWPGLEAISTRKIDFRFWTPEAAEKKFLEAANTLQLPTQRTGGRS